MDKSTCLLNELQWRYTVYQRLPPNAFSGFGGNHRALQHWGSVARLTRLKKLKRPIWIHLMGSHRYEYNTQHSLKSVSNIRMALHPRTVVPPTNRHRRPRRRIIWTGQLNEFIAHHRSTDIKRNPTENRRRHHEAFSTRFLELSHGQEQLQLSVNIKWIALPKGTNYLYEPSNQKKFSD